MKSGVDVRYGLTDVVSHDGTRMPCLAVGTLQEFRATIGDAEYDEVSCTHDRSLSRIETKPNVCFRGRLETLIH